MSNYVVSGRPGSGTFNLSQPIRDEFTAIQEAIATKSDVGGLSATSITSLTIGLGVKTLVVQANKEFVVGQTVFMADSFDPSTNNMTGILTSYNSSTGLMTVDVDSINGSGTESSWIVGVSNASGVTLGSNTFTGSQNFSRATVASHATTADIWSANGNQIDFTGTATVTAFPAAQQAGAWRELICADACSFTASANLKIAGVLSGATYTAAANDVVMVRALTTTTFLLTIQKYNGKPSMTAGHKLVLKDATAGSGSTSTRIGRFSTVVTNTGEGVEWNYADSATLGGSITLLQSGWYSINFFTTPNNGVNSIGISINTTQLTTNFASLTNDSERLFTAPAIATGSFYGYIEAGTVLRAHHANNWAGALMRLTMERII